MYENIRIFTAIALSEDARRSISALVPEWQINLSFDRWVYPEDWHLTLHFIGDVPVSSLPLVEEALREACSEQPNPFQLEINGLGTFGKPDRPSVLWLGLSSLPEELPRLHEALGNTLADKLGFTPEKRPYGPHVTLARKYTGAAPFQDGLLSGFNDKLKTNAVSWNVDGIVAYRTHMGRKPMYEEVARVMFPQA
ncbi:RNA 2',3'-cyclic phosphodiesterase [Paenibacillus thailandensis]|uniref:RNA 2',3'-cyclic phosphodiesterase n=1 Tax=Paenibacillus thailandensis TaxID=393250 RepID=A0ABW5QRT6_9BACL